LTRKSFQEYAGILFDVNIEILKIKGVLFLVSPRSTKIIGPAYTISSPAMALCQGNLGA
jgi:hypothetical protein